MSCRNLLIYFAPELQKKLMPLFHYSLNPGGVLFLGSAESTAGFADLFSALPGNSKLYRRQEPSRRAESVLFPSAFIASPLDEPKATRMTALNTDSLQTQAEQWLLRHHASPAVLVNDQGDILFVNGSTGGYLEPAAGKANWNVFVMARADLRYELTAAFQRARRDTQPVTTHRIKVGANGLTTFVCATVQFFDEPAALRGLAMIVFKDADGPTLERKVSTAQTGKRTSRAQELERELQQARDEIQSTREEMQTSQEELKSMNEELQSANEELQSTNEELTTSKEEMQSLNEELQTVNAELQVKVEDLSAASNDMKNLLNSTEIATIFLDNALHVRRFTEQATAIIKLIPGDIGRPITDLASNLLYPELPDDARDVLRTLVPVAKTLEARDGRWFAMRLMPYRTMDDRIGGVVITFTNMTIVKKLEAELRARLSSKEGKP